jgi:moderate conductance mechanosensitive channel
VLRDASGTVHSIANGEIRINSNLTRYYASAVVDVVGIGESDVGRAIEVMDRVGAELAADAAWADHLLEPPAYVSTTAFTDLGVTLRMVGRVLPADRWKVSSELRRRLSIAFAEAGITPNRRPIGASSGPSGDPDRG